MFKFYLNNKISFSFFGFDVFKILLISIFIVSCQADVNGPLGVDPNEKTQIDFSNTPTEIAIADSFNFGHIPIGASIEKLVYVLNTGTRDVNDINFMLPPTHFTYTGGAFPGTSGTCTDTLIEAARCILDLTYACLLYTSPSPRDS